MSPLPSASRPQMLYEDNIITKLKKNQPTYSFIL